MWEAEAQAYRWKKMEFETCMYISLATALLSVACCHSHGAASTVYRYILLCSRERSRDTRSGTKDCWVCILGIVHYLKSLPGWQYLVTWRGWFQRLCWVRHLLARDHRTQQRVASSFTANSHSVSQLKVAGYVGSPRRLHLPFICDPLPSYYPGKS